MLNVSVPAAARLSHLLNAQAEDAVVRIVRRRDRLRMRLGQLRPGDQTFKHDGRIVLALDQQVGKTLSRRQLDVRQTNDGPRLKLKSH